MTRLDEIVAGLNESYPMYWTGPRYQVPDRDVRALVEVARALIRTNDAIDTLRTCPICIDKGHTCRQCWQMLASVDAQNNAALAPLVGEGSGE
jgi:hypothetical protein